jgi:hypothetical protein
MNLILKYLQYPWQHYSFHAWGPENGPSSQSVHETVQMLKQYYNEYAPLINPEKVATTIMWEMGPPTWVPNYQDLQAHRYSVVVTPFISSFPLPLSPDRRQVRI